MTHVRIIGASALMIGGAMLGIVGRRRRRKLTADDLMRMDDGAFGEHIRSTGMTAQVHAALARIDRGSPA